MEVSSGTIHDNPWLGVPSSQQLPRVQSTMTSRQRGIQRRGGGRNINNNNNDETEEQRRRRQHFTCTDWTLHTLVQAFLGIDIAGCLFWLIYGLILVFYLHHSDKHNNNNNNHHHNNNEKNNNHTNTLLADSDYNNNNNNHDATLMMYDSYNSEYYADAEWMTTGSSSIINHNNGSSSGSSSYHHWPAALALEWSLWLGVRVLCVTAALYYSQIVNLCGLLVASYISIVLSIQHLLLSLLSAIYRHDLHHLNWWHSHYLLFGSNDDDNDKNNIKNGLIVWFFETWEPWLWLIFLILAIVECPIRYGVYQQYRQRLLQQEEDDLQQTAFISRASTQRRPWWWSSSTSFARQQQQQGRGGGGIHTTTELDQLRQSLLATTTAVDNGDEYYHDMLQNALEVGGSGNGGLGDGRTTLDPHDNNNDTKYGMPDWVQEENDYNYQHLVSTVVENSNRQRRVQQQQQRLQPSSTEVTAYDRI